MSADLEKLAKAFDATIGVSKTPSEILTVNEALYNQAREALAKEGYAFVVNVQPLSIGQLAKGEETAPLFGYIDLSKKMRSNVPPQIEIAIDPNHLKIEGSNNSSTTEQIRKIEQQKAMLKSRLPKDVGDIIGMCMFRHASILAQLDFEYQKRTGKALFTNWFGRTDDQTVSGGVAVVGRGDSSFRLSVDVWPRGLDFGHVFAVSAVVLPRKSAV